ncbi:MAG: hypothetical protein HYU84_00905 [Chloroflexi bacterium]|nr:hypothetical protein [Chloroflexota bacterium]MBI3169884.1 hypothetical protein [Chloroflexota bacterium]
MKQKFLITISVLALLALSACGGGEATPEISAEDLASTAVAEAWLVITQTALAAPTATPIPPTFTPQPTATTAPTLALLPTQQSAAPAGIVATATPECNQIPALEPKGTLVTVEFYNQSGGRADLAFGMIAPNDKSECYTYSFSFGNSDPSSNKVLAGCYWGYAWISGGETSVARSGDKIMCMTDTAVVYKVVITEERVDFK